MESIIVDNEFYWDQLNNITKVVIDDKLIRFLDGCREKLDMNEFYIDRSGNILEQMDLFASYRRMAKSAVKNGEITLKRVFIETKAGTIQERKFGMPDYYALGLALINENSNVIKGWKNISNLAEIEIMNDIDITIMNNLDNHKTIKTNRIVNIIKQKGICCCGHAINNIHEVKLRYVRRKIVMGCCCVEKRLITNETNKKLYREMVKRDIKIMENFRKCEQCETYSIEKTEPRWKKQCKTCYFENKNKLRGQCFLKAPKLKGQCFLKAPK